MEAPFAPESMRIDNAHLMSLARVWNKPRVLRLQIAVNPRLKSTLARWRPPSNVLEISSTARSRSSRALREIIAHEAAHVLVWERFGHLAQPHGPEWATLMRSAGFEPRATHVRCGQRRRARNGNRVRHFCAVCHFYTFAKRRIPSWRCPNCRSIGLEGMLNVERVSNR